MIKNKLISIIIMKAIFITTDGIITLGEISSDVLLNKYELYSPISKYQITIGVLPIHRVPKSNSGINTIATDIYRGSIIGDVVIVSDDCDEIEPYYNELIAKYK